MFLIDDLLFAPAHGLTFILKQIQTLVERELDDESLLKEQLIELELRRELGEIGDEEFEQRQADVFARLRVVNQRKLEQLQQIHTAETASLVIESPEEGAGFGEFEEEER